MNILFNYSIRRWARIRSEFPRLWKNYLYQSFLAVIVLCIAFSVLSMEHVVIIASLGATAFIVFTMPRNTTASPRKVIGGHIIGLGSGALASLIPHYMVVSYIIVYSIAVGISIFLMVALDFEHPPASGTALGVAITGFSVDVLIAVITASVIIALAHKYLRRYLRDLT